MTPQEKAKDIFVKMLEYIPDHLIKDNKDAAEVSKIHALIAVDEILKSRPSLPIEAFGGTINLGECCKLSKEYWQQVKTEIEKL